MNTFYVTAKPKKSKGKKKKSTVKENEETINIVPPSVPEVIKLESANNTVSILCKPLVFNKLLKYSLSSNN